MQVVIDIPEEKYNMIKNKMYCGIYDAEVYKAISKGTPLPAGHGRLIDVAVLRQKMGNLIGFDLLGRCIDEEPTIIEADGGNEE